MKKLSVLFFSCFLSFAFIAQTENQAMTKRLTYGFSIGFNYSNLFAINGIPSYANISNDFGYRLGLLADYKFNDKWSVSPKLELSINNTSIAFYPENEEPVICAILPASIDFAPHVVYKLNKKETVPYFYAGPAFKTAVWNENAKFNAMFYLGYDFSFDVGIGVDKLLPNFNFRPELRYSYGLRNISPFSVVKTLRFHNIALVFNFIG